MARAQKRSTSQAEQAEETSDIVTTIVQDDFNKSQVPWPTI